MLIIYFFVFFVAKVVKINLTNTNNPTFKVLSKPKAAYTKKEKRDHTTATTVRTVTTLGSKKQLRSTEFEETTDTSNNNSDIQTVAYAESLSALDPNIVEYLFKIKLLNENNSRLDDFELSVQCLKMSTNAHHVNSISLNGDFFENYFTL
jgi:hypothetical protein